jgi:hypothetical protein
MTVRTINYECIALPFAGEWLVHTTRYASKCLPRAAPCGALLCLSVHQQVQVQMLGAPSVLVHMLPVYVSNI